MSILLSAFFSRAIYAQNKVIPKEESFNSEAFYRLTDWEFYKGVCDANNTYYRKIKDWSKDTSLSAIGNRIKVIQRLDSLLTEMNDSMLIKEYSFFANASSELKKLVDTNAAGKQNSETNRNLKYAMDSLYVVGMKELIRRCNLDSGFGTTNYSRQYLSYLNDYSNLQRMYITYESFMNLKTNKQSMHISPADAQGHFQSIADRMNEIERGRFAMYSTYNATPVGIKAFSFSHGNDVLAPGINNQDQDMTGNFRFEFSTDLFKARWLNLAWLSSGIIGAKKDASYRVHKLSNPKYSMLSYQNLSLGGDGYTPYIRYRNNFELADTLHQHDRPFGSYVYIERRKFRLWPKGLIRHNGTFQIGMLGLMTGQYLQAELHKDAIYDSQKVYGWEKQTGYGGRWLMQINHEVDVLLFSNTNKYPSIFTPNRNRLENVERRGTCNKVVQQTFGDVDGRYAGANIILNAKMQYGGYLTAFSSGITFSTLDFIHQSGHYVVTQRRNNMFGFGWHIELGVKYRYVVHNSMLEGLGYVKSFPDDVYDDESVSVYTLQRENVNRHLWLADLKMVFQWRKMSFYYQLNLNRIEYRLPKIDLNSPEIQAMVNNYAIEDPTFPEEFASKIAPEFIKAQDRTFYGYGTLGMTWRIN